MRHPRLPVTGKGTLWRLGWSAAAAASVAACAAGGAGTATGARAGDAAGLIPTIPADLLAVDSLRAGMAQVGLDSAADQRVLDSLHQRGWRPADSPEPEVGAPTLRGDEVAQEAERLFGQEGRAVMEAVGAEEAEAESPAEEMGAAGFAQPAFDIDVTSFAANRRVLEYLEFFQVDARDRFEIWVARLGRYEGMIRERLRAKGLPEDLVYLTLIESGLSNTAVSRARAVGMWQFIAGTARLYGLTVDPWVDERRDPYRATDAAVQHLADLRDRLGSVYLAAAAYNAGAGRIVRGIGRLPGEVDSLTDHTFFQLAERRYLRRETRDYVPKLIAASLIAKQPARYGFTDVRPLPPLVFDEITVPDATGLDVIARLADTAVVALLELNPQFVRGLTPPDRSVIVRVPRGRGTHVAERYAELPVNERITFVDHYVSRGQTLSEIAGRYRVTVAMIRSANPQLKPHALRIGQRIVVPMSGRVVPRSAWSVPPEPRYVRVTSGPAPAGSHRVRSGETLSAIARKYGVSLGALLDYNGLTMRSIIRPGELLRISDREGLD